MHKTHEGSSTAMEVVVIRSIFGRSMEKNNIRITGYVGDGNSKAYHTIAEKSHMETILALKYMSALVTFRSALAKI